MLKKIQTKLRSNKGFTLIELMIVIAILGVLAAVAIPYYNQYIENSKMRVTRSNWDAAVRTVKAEFSSLTAGNTGNDNLLNVLTDNSKNKNPFNTLELAFSNGTPSSRGVVRLTETNFNGFAIGTAVTIDANINGTADETITLTYE